MIDLLNQVEPFVAFVGAGVSALPPSNLPTWNGFNSLLLECLCERVRDFSRDRQPTSDILSQLKARRDGTRFFSPDFQAQLMEEEVGPDYFLVWQSLETAVYGPVHAQLAELAARGRLAAIVTTNFDRLIEIALNARAQPFEVFHDEASFRSLAGGDYRIEASLPIIKIHGSIEDPSSLVDTLRQRVVGRSDSLQAVLDRLLLRFVWVYLGFSGADFSYVPNYLNVLDSAPDARGFIFVADERFEIQEGVRRLEKAYGPEKASIVPEGDRATWLSRTFELGEPSFIPGYAADQPDTSQVVRTRIQKWVDSLGSMSAVNILYSMLKCTGLENQALWLLRKTWKSYRTPDDTHGKAYHRYNYNYGVSLLEVGFIQNPVQLEDDLSNAMEWRDGANQNAFEYLGRSYWSGQLLAAGAQLACVRAYRGEIGKAIALLSKVTDDASAAKAWLDVCDVSISSAVVYDIVQMFSGPVEQFRWCLERVSELGDEPRRAQLCVHLGRFLTYAGQFSDADQFLIEADSIGRRLDLQPVLLSSKAARGLWLAESGTSVEEAVRTLGEVAGNLRALEDEPLFSKFDLAREDSQPTPIRGHRPLHCRVLLDLNRAAMLAGDERVMNATLDALDELVVEVFPGYCPHYYLVYAQCLILHGGGDSSSLIHDLIDRARRLGELQENPWVAQESGRILGVMR